ncbi:GatB/YqeY domain-containing protein [Thioclava sp. GXIMD4216]|uniref:GatB/YqeY domain-containing protein n=1 Tax=Thioclava litoralis TaxID=3076557 RepID=A0ABZ1DY77_9RHOB|nr:GatB/YqeY domain-containing protein [Thioclava sp. FTW29]
MDMRAKINAALKEAMREKDQGRLSTLRLVNAAIKDREIAMRGSNEEHEINDSDVMQILGKMVKQRHESARAYEEGGRLELAEQELSEIKILETFLPRQLTDDEVKAAIDAAIAAIDAQSIRDMGRVMAVLKEKYTGQMDFASVGPRVKDRLSI